MDTKPVPTLSVDGWVRTTEQKCDALLSHFFVSDKSQTDYFGSEAVHSFAQLLQANQNDMMGTVNAVQRSLEVYFGAYFPSVTVEVRQRDIEPNGSKVSLHIYVNVTDVEGKEFSIGRLAQIADTKIQQILNLNNFGTKTP